MGHRATRLRRVRRLKRRPGQPITLDITVIITLSKTLNITPTITLSLTAMRARTRWAMPPILSCAMCCSIWPVPTASVQRRLTGPVSHGLRQSPRTWSFLQSASCAGLLRKRVRRLCGFENLSGASRSAAGG